MAFVRAPYLSSATTPSSGTTLMPTLCINTPQNAAAAAKGDGCDNAANVNGGYLSTVSKGDAVASIATIVPCPDEAPPPSSFVYARPSGGFTLTRCRMQQRLPLCCSACKPGTILSFSGYSHLWWQVERWRNTTINRSWGLVVGSQQAAADRRRVVGFGRARLSSSLSIATTTTKARDDESKDGAWDNPRCHWIRCHVGRRTIKGTEEAKDNTCRTPDPIMEDMKG